jgi:predicted DCC family thiol-disulfide oxidoreductase YuxK
MEPAVIVYDAGCPFCRWATRTILAWDRRHRLRAVALQAPESERLLAPVPSERRADSWHLVRGGRVRSAGAAVGPLLRLLPGGTAPALVAESFPRTTERLYRWVSAHRETLGRLVAGNPCARGGHGAKGGGPESADPKRPGT